MISASFLPGDPADCAKVFHLEGLVDLAVLPPPWASTTMSPLRDRLMIEWMFSQTEALTQLKMMVSESERLIKQAQRAGEERVRIGVVCSDGALLSPCFVEKLYEHLFELGMNEGLRVTRYHWDAFSAAWGWGPGTVWQQKYVSKPRSVADELDDMERLWVYFQPDQSERIERAFVQDPFAVGVALGDDTIDFETGVIFKKRTKRTHRIRCVRVDNSRVECYQLTNKTYKRIIGSYSAAGILPYAPHPHTGDPLFLLGHLNYGYNDWSDFGGLKGMLEKSGRVTAARECSEETLHIIGDASYFVSALENYVENNVFKVVNENTQYVSHFLRVEYKDYPELFQQERTRSPKAKVEMEEIRWFPLASLKKAAQMLLTNQTSFKVEALLSDGTYGGDFPLRMELVETMCIAEGLGVLNRVDSICHDHHHHHHSRKHRSAESPSEGPSRTPPVVGPRGSSVDLADNSAEDAGDPGMISEEEKEEGVGTPCAKITPGHQEAVDGIVDQMAGTRIDVVGGATPTKQGCACPDVVVVIEDVTSSPYSKFTGVVKRLLPSPEACTAAKARHHQGRQNAVITESYGMGAGHVV